VRTKYVCAWQSLKTAENKLKKQKEKINNTIIAERKHKLTFQDKIPYILLKCKQILHTYHLVWCTQLSQVGHHLKLIKEGWTIIS
jgi:hypothetical protein